MYSIGNHVWDRKDIMNYIDKESACVQGFGCCSQFFYMFSEICNKIFGLIAEKIMILIVLTVKLQVKKMLLDIFLMGRQH